MMNKIKKLFIDFLINTFKLNELYKNIENELVLSEKKYRNLFENNPQPLWIYDLETLAFLEVNKAAIEQYGYSRSEFLKMTLKDIRPKEDVSDLLNDVANTTKELNKAGEWRHLKKNGEIIFVEIVSHTLDYESRKARLVHSFDVTKRIQSEQKLRVLSQAVEQNPASILITDTKGNIEYINTKFTEVTGYLSEEIIGKNPNILNSGISTPEIYNELWKTIQAGNEWQGQFQNRKKNGEIFFESAVILPILNEKGDITHFLSIKEDITHKIHSEKQIKTLSKAIEQSPSSIIITDAEGKIEFVNFKFTSLMQYSMEEVKGRSPRIFNPGHTNIDAYETMWEKLRSKKVWEGEFENRKKDKNYFWENVIIAPLLDEKSLISNYILIMEDISEKKKMIQELIDAKEKAQESDRLKTAFLQNMSHEIRTPMNAIIGFSDLLPDVFDSPEKLLSYTTIIKERSSHLLQIINDILDIAKIESGQLPIHVEMYDLNSLFRELESFFTEYQERINKKHINFNINSSPLDSPILIDQIKLKQILINLISNAFKFTHEGNVQVDCLLSINNVLLFSVSDTGIGIAENKKNEIFNRFNQIDSDTARLYEGTGLGLSIVKGILDLLGGKVWLESEPDKGSTFYFTFPYKLTNS